RVPRRDLRPGDARAVEPGASGVTPGTLSPRAGGAVPGRGGARGHLLGLRVGPQDPARPGRVGLAERVAAARGGHAHRRTRWLGADAARDRRTLTDHRASRPRDTQQGPGAVRV